PQSTNPNRSERRLKPWLTRLRTSRKRTSASRRWPRSRRLPVAGPITTASDSRDTSRLSIEALQQDPRRREIPNVARLDPPRTRTLATSVAEIGPDSANRRIPTRPSGPAAKARQGGGTNDEAAVPLRRIGHRATLVWNGR